ncbi:MAG: ABC transporter substrate-binding protein [Stackebrandtia sp.]
MFRNRFAWRAVAVAGVAALTVSLAACGGGDEDAGDQIGPGDDPYEGTLKVGTIFPDSGSLSFLSPPMYAGVELALEDISAAGGVWGNDIELTSQDEGDADDSEVVAAAADAHIENEVHGVIGAASSTSSLNIIEALYNQKIIQISASNTGPDFTGHEFGEFYFRTAPSDILQGSVLANEIAADGHATAGVIAMQNDYGEGLADRIEEVYNGAGGDTVVKEFFDPNAPEYDGEIAALRDADPDAIAIVSYEQAAQIFPALSEAGLGPDKKQWYLVDGNLSDWSSEFDTKDLNLEGVKGTRAVSEEESQEFYDRMYETDHLEDDGDTTYGPQSYDAVVALALAAIAANSEDPDAIREQMVNITAGDEDCNTFEKCKKLLEEGTSIRYVGQIGALDWTEDGDLGHATIGLHEYGDDNNFELYRSETSEMEE